MRLFEIEQQVEIVDGEDFYKFLDHPENADVFDRLHYLFSSEIRKELHFVIRDGDKIVAVAGLQENPGDNKEYWVKHYSVDKNYQNSGLATKLVNAVFKFAHQNNVSLKRSTPSEMGTKYLTGPIDHAKKQYPNVNAIDYDK